MKLAIMVLNLERKNKNMSNNVDIDILNIVSENDFDKDTTTKEYRESVLEAIKIEKMLVNNLAESVKFLATNPNLSKEEIIELFSNPEYKDYFNKLNREE